MGDKSIERTGSQVRITTPSTKKSLICFEILYKLRNCHFSGLNEVLRKDVHNCLKSLLKYSSHFKICICGDQIVFTYFTLHMHFNRWIAAGADMRT
jgi:hypothetical protein